MTYLDHDKATKPREFPRLEFEQVGPQVVFTVWMDENTQGPRFVTNGPHDLLLLQNFVASASLYGASEKKV